MGKVGCRIFLQEGFLLLAALGLSLGLALGPSRRHTRAFDLPTLVTTPAANIVEVRDESEICWHRRGYWDVGEATNFL